MDVQWIRWRWGPDTKTMVEEEPTVEPLIQYEEKAEGLRLDDKGWMVTVTKLGEEGGCIFQRLT